jgi:hypothetical protein
MQLHGISGPRLDPARPAFSVSQKLCGPCLPALRGEGAQAAGLSISVRMLCPEHSRLLQHYEATLRRWAEVEWSSNRNEPNALLRVSAEIEKKKALHERDAARERLNLHQRSCPTCIHNQHNPHLIK